MIGKYEFLGLQVKLVTFLPKLVPFGKGGTRSCIARLSPTFSNVNNSIFPVQERQNVSRRDSQAYSTKEE